jgi:hypothetical protein
MINDGTGTNIGVDFTLNDFLTRVFTTLQQDRFMIPDIPAEMILKETPYSMGITLPMYLEEKSGL